jgi:hypothetical protein
MIGEDARAEDLFPGAAALFHEPLRDGTAARPVRWVAGLLVVGVVVLVGRAVVGWMNRNL